METATDRSIFRRARRIELAANRLVESLVSGNYRSVFRGQGMEFDEVREYVSGDDVRLIDWNVTSRMGAAFTKVYKEERELHLALLIDVSPSVMTGDPRKRELVAWVAAVMALSAQRTGDIIGAFLFSDRVERRIAPDRGRTHVLRLINDVIEFDAQGGGSDLAAAMRTATETLHRRGICVVISDFKTDGFWHELGLLRRRHDVMAVRIAEPADASFPVAGSVELVDPETGLQVYAPGGSRRFREQYKEYWEFHLLELRNRCRRRKVDLVEIQVGEDPGAKLAAFFRRKNRRRSR